jgi:N-acetylglucosamine malate deacetylase 1
MWKFFRAKQLQAHLAALDACPLPQPLDLTLAKKVMVFAPHPDDETLGCGGTLIQLAQHCAVQVVLVTDGSGAGGLPPGAGETRQAEFVRALQKLGIHDFVLLNQPDGAFTQTAALEAHVRQLMNAFQPDWVFLPSPLDYHRDHVRIAAFLEPICWQVRSVQKVLFFEVWAPVPATHIVDITQQAEQKNSALAEHQTALACGDYQAAVTGLNQYRGLYLGRGRVAEAFWVETRSQERLFLRVQELAFKLLKIVSGR